MMMKLHFLRLAFQRVRTHLTPNPIAAIDMLNSNVFFFIDNVLLVSKYKHTKKGLCLMIGLPTHEQGCITRYCQGCFGKENEQVR